MTAENDYEFVKGTFLLCRKIVGIHDDFDGFHITFDFGGEVLLVPQTYEDGTYAGMSIYRVMKKVDDEKP